MKSSKVRLGIYCPGKGTGGPWRYVHSILASLDLDEFDTTIFCDLPGVYEPRPRIAVVRLSDDSPGSSPAVQTSKEEVSQAIASGPRVGSYVPTSARLWAGFAKESRKVARRLRGHRIDLLHTQCTGCEESPVAARLAGIGKVVGTFHVDSTYDLHRVRSSANHKLMEALSNRCLDVAIAVSHSTKRDWVRRTHIPAKRVATIHNGIDPDKFRRRQSRQEARRMLGLSTNGPVVGAVGRLEDAKGFSDLIASVPSLLGEFPELTVAIAGAGPLRDALEAQADALGISSAVRFCGFMSDVQPLLDALDAFAFPSLCETLGYALLEAMATGVPAVGSTVGGIPEVIVPGETGFLVPPRNPSELSRAIATLLRSQELRDRFGSSSRERVVKFFQERDMVRRTIELYRGIC